MFPAVLLAPGNAAAAAAAFPRPGGPGLTDSLITDPTRALIELMKSREGTLSHSCSSNANTAAPCYQPFQLRVSGNRGAN